MEMYRFAVAHDWPVLTPILVCSIVAVAVALERLWYYRTNGRGAAQFLSQFEKQLAYGPLQAKRWVETNAGIIPEVASEGLRILTEHPGRFVTLFEVASSLASRKLYRGLTILGTIATISPYLGLFGTVVRILLTFGEMAQSQNVANSSSIMFGIGSALIATAFGLAVAIFAVAANNSLQSMAEGFEKDFEIVELLCLSVRPETVATRRAAIPDEKRVR